MTPRLVAIAFILGLSLGCAPRNPALTPHGQALVDADSVVLRLGELGDTAIAANQAGAIPRDVAVKVAKFTRSAVLVVKEAPDGWQAAVRALWAALRLELDESVKLRLGVAWKAAEALLGAS